MSESVAIFFDDAMTNYDFGRGHPLSPIRLRLTMDLIRELGLLSVPGVELIAPEPAHIDALARAHDRSYIEAVERCSEQLCEPELDFGLGTDDNPTFVGMHQYSALIAGGTLQAAQSVWSGSHQHAINLAGGFHHAMPDRAAGFCVYNDLAVAIAWLLDNGAARVAYIDVDVHHGDGVERVFWDDPRVMTISLHESGATQFPGTGWPLDVGGPNAQGSAVNCALPAGAGDREWLRALDAVAGPLLAAFKPDVVISQHGCDGHQLDPLGHMNLSINGQTAMAQHIHQWVHKFTAGKWIVTGGGGYAIVEVVPRAWAQLVSQVVGANLTSQAVLPSSWRSNVQETTGIDAPQTLGELTQAPVELGTHSWLDSCDLDNPTDQAIAATREATFRFHGLDPLTNL